MSDFHQQAIEDVARATNRELFEVETDEEVGSSAGANELESMTTCAVAQRERVLELENTLKIIGEGIIRTHPKVSLRLFQLLSAPEKAKP